MNLANNLESSAFHFPDRPAVRNGDTEISYRQLNDRTNRVATGLIKLGIRPGDRIGLCAPNSIDWIAFYFAVIKTGAVAITLPSLLRGENSIRYSSIHNQDSSLPQMTNSMISKTCGARGEWRKPSVREGT